MPWGKFPAVRLHLCLLNEIEGSVDLEIDTDVMGDDALLDPVGDMIEGDVMDGDGLRGVASAGADAMEAGGEEEVGSFAGQACG